MYVGELRGREKLDYVRPTITDVAMRCNNMEYFLCLSFVGGRLEPTDRTQKSRGEKAARARTARRRRTLLRATAKVGAGSSFFTGLLLPCDCDCHCEALRRHTGQGDKPEEDTHAVGYLQTKEKITHSSLFYFTFSKHQHVYSLNWI